MLKTLLLNKSQAVSVSRRLATLANGVKVIDLKNNEKNVMLTILDSDSERKVLRFNSHWLRFNCHGKTSKHPTTNQRQIDAMTIPLDLKVENVQIVMDELKIEWNKESKQSSSTVPLIYLYNNCPANFKAKDNSTFASIKPCREITFFDYNKMFDKEGKKNDEEALKWLNHMAEYGLAVVQNFTTKPDYQVAKFASSMVAPISYNIYGDVYDVKVEPNPYNIANDNGPLPFHMDLVYYEAPPGLQFIHCIKFDESIKGGESLLVDSFDVAEQFRKDFPEYFQTLATTPVRFQKMHVKDGRPELMVHHRPHIKLNHRNEIISTTWSPANEGPLKNLPDEQVEKYYEAYLEYSKAINTSSSIIEYKLKPGEIMCFNNRRMMHGRKGFEQSNGERHFQGCYVNIDEYKSVLRSAQLKKSLINQTFVDLKEVNIEKLPVGNNDFE